MKKIFSVLLLMLTFISCVEDVKFNTPAVQGRLNNVLWRAQQTNAIVGSDGTVTVYGYRGFETLEIKIASATPGTYELGVDEMTKVTFTIEAPDNAAVYETGTGTGDGQVVLQEVDVVNGTVTGTFRFNAPLTFGVPSAGQIVNMQSGNFYKVPILAIGQ